MIGAVPGPRADRMPCAIVEGLLGPAEIPPQRIQRADWVSEPEGQIEALSGAAVAAQLRLHLERLGLRSGRI